MRHAHRSPQLVLIAGLAITACGPAIAQSKDAASADPIDRLVAQLGAADPEARIDATAQLMEYPDLTDERLGRLLRQAADPETRNRLVSVAMHRFYAEHMPNGADPDDTKGSLGIVVSNDNIIRPEQDPRLSGPGLLVTMTQPGFPANVKLRVGDIIEGIDDQMFGAGFSDEWFRAEVKDHKAGDVVRLQILRKDRHITVEVRFASFSRLDVINELLRARGGDATQYRPWRDYYERLMQGPAVSTPRIVLDGPFPDKSR